MNLSYIQTVIHYNYTLHRRVWDSIMQISDAQFVEDVPYSIGSLRNHAVHLMNVDRRWWCRVMMLPLPEQRLQYEDFPTRDSARLEWDDMEKFILDSASSLTESDLERPIEIKIASRPNANIKPVWQVLVHVVNHGTDHRAQMLPILHRFGAPTFDQDLMYYLWED